MKIRLYSCLMALVIYGATSFAEEAKKDVFLLESHDGQGKIQLGPISVAVSVSSATTDHPKKSAYLGVVTSALAPQLRAQLNLAEGMGLSVDAVAKDSPAEKAGLKQYDVLKKFNDQQLCAQEQLAVLVNAAGKGAKVTLGIIRGGKEQSLEATLGEHEGPPPGQVQFSVNGVPGVAVDLQDLDAKRFGETMARAGLNGFYRALADGQSKEPASGGIHERWDERQKALQEKQKEIQEHVANEVRKAQEAAKKAGADRAHFTQLFSVYPDEHKTNHKDVILTDNDGTLELTDNDGQRTVKIKDASGQEVYSGPLNSAADHQALPEKFRAKAAKAEEHLKEAALPPSTRSQIKPQKQDAPEEPKKGGAI
jgi:hypothetical protein